MNKKNVATALVVSLIVGSLLNLINSYDVFIEKKFSTANAIKIILTYITLFCVSLFSSMIAVKTKKYE